MGEPQERSPFPEGDAPEEVDPGVWRIPLPLPYALRAVNAYLIDEGPDARTLIDSGLGLPADEAALRAGLAHVGISLADITTLVLTHAHPDHIGLSGLVYGESGADVVMLAGEDARMRTVWADPSGDIFKTISAMFVRHGLPESFLPAIEAGTMRMLRMLRLAPGDAIRTVEDGETLTLGSHAYQAVWTPGHSDRHLCLLRDDGLCIVGDHVLPNITPNIGYYPDSLVDPVGSYLAALEMVANLPSRLALPGHGRPFADLAGRARTIARHHKERSQQICDALATMATGAHAVAVTVALFGERLRTKDDWRFALVETLAHLEHLRLSGRLVRREDAHGFQYALRAASRTKARPIPRSIPQ